MESSNKLKNILSPAKWDQDTLFITYKLLYDALFVELLFFALAMFAEGVIPGIIISHIGFSKIVILIAFTLLAVSSLGRMPKIKELELPKSSSTGKKTIFFFVLFAALIMFNSQFRLNIFLNLLFLAASLVLGYFIFQILREE